MVSFFVVDALFSVDLFVGVLCLFLVLLLSSLHHFSFAIILIGKRELVASL